MKRNRFLILALWLALALATGLTAAPAAQAASCYGSGCAGQDPQSTGCSSGAANVSGTEYWASSFSRAMRNSGTCSARWARLVIDNYLPTCCYAISTAIESQRYYAGNWIAGDWRSRRVGAGLEGSFWTPMIANLSDDRPRVPPLGGDGRLLVRDLELFRMGFVTPEARPGRARPTSCGHSAIL